MSNKSGSIFLPTGRAGLLAVARVLPLALRTAIYRHFIHCDISFSKDFEYKIAETRQELEDCFSLMHDASGAKPHEKSGIRLTQYQTLPSSSTLCVKYKGQIVGAASIVKDGLFGLPLQDSVDLQGVRCQGGNIAEVTDLAILSGAPVNRQELLLSLFKFIQLYCMDYFDIQCILFSVDESWVDCIELVFLAKRLHAQDEHGDRKSQRKSKIEMVIDLKVVEKRLRFAYQGRAARRNLHKYFFGTSLSNVNIQNRQYYTTNDPVITPQVFNYFFKEKTNIFDAMAQRNRVILRSIYCDPSYASIFPVVEDSDANGYPMRKHQRHSIRCPGMVTFRLQDGERNFVLDVIEMSLTGFQAESKLELPVGLEGHVKIDLGRTLQSAVKATVVRRRLVNGSIFFGFSISEADLAWKTCVASLEGNSASVELIA